MKLSTQLLVVRDDWRSILRPSNQQFLRDHTRDTDNLDVLPLKRSCTQ